MVSESLFVLLVDTDCIITSKVYMPWGVRICTDIGNLFLLILLALLQLQYSAICLDSISSIHEN